MKRFASRPFERGSNQEGMFVHLGVFEEPIDYFYCRRVERPAPRRPKMVAFARKAISLSLSASFSIGLLALLYFSYPTVSSPKQPTQGGISMFDLASDEAMASSSEETPPPPTSDTPALASRSDAPPEWQRIMMASTVRAKSATTPATETRQSGSPSSLRRETISGTTLVTAAQRDALEALSRSRPDLAGTYRCRRLDDGFRCAGKDSTRSRDVAREISEILAQSVPSGTSMLVSI
ncbi:hypothetical protein [Sphingomicrobium arenosum]|uniref:hypothetical protein n=1 Tax=Sphingomicrobium arenosum TaxID=2233861 RepID=UPI002240EEA9|nr:hypothetical protein [Sphingomicrobium arenosum]